MVRDGMAQQKNQPKNPNSLILLVFWCVMARNGIKKSQSVDWDFDSLVPRGGIEPPLLSEPDFESGASTNSTTSA